jgi:hypothetical protein
MGMGSMTGRGAGYCGRNTSTGYGDAGEGRFGGTGCCGRRHGFRHWFQAIGLPGWMRFRTIVSSGSTGNMNEEEVNLLKIQSEFFTKALEDVKARLMKIETNE